MNATVSPHPSHNTHLQRAVEIVLLVGAGLVIAAGLVLLGGSWGEFTLATRLAIAASGAVVLAIASGIVATRSPGIRALSATDFHSEHEGRRMLTAVLMVGTAAMTAFTVAQFPMEPEMVNYGYEYLPVEPYWTASIALGAALVISLLAAWIAPGVVTTLAVCGFTAGTVITLMSHYTWNWTDEALSFRNSWLIAVVFAGLGLAGALLASRWLRPGILVVALSLFAWFISGVQAATEGETFRDAPLDVPQRIVDAATLTGNVGKVSLAALLILGVVMFLTRATWPWPAAAIASLVALTLVMTTNALGVAAALLITGALLILASGGMLLIWRRRSATDDAPDPLTMTDSVTVPAATGGADVTQ